MNKTISPAPVKRSIVVKATPARAFAVFTGDPTAWWPREHTIGQSPLKEVVIEPRIGGRWYERGEDGSTCEWGKVLAWDAPSRVVLAWQIGADWQYRADLVTEVEVTFSAVDGGTRVDLEHRNLDRFGDAADQTRAMLDSANGWPATLARFAAIF